MGTYVGDNIAEAVANAFRGGLKRTSMHTHDVTIEANCCRLETDLAATCWFTQQAWTRLFNSYFPGEDAMTRFKEQVRSFGTKTKAASLRFLDRPEQAQRKVATWGGCLLAITARSRPRTLVLHSRASMVGYTGLLDAAMAEWVARQLEWRDARFRWVIDLATVHPFKSLFYWWHLGRPGGQFTDQFVQYERDILAAYRKHGSDIGLPRHRKRENPEAYEVYGPLRRVKQRWLAIHKRDYTWVSKPKPLWSHEL